jgi:hypothetical protein
MSRTGVLSDNAVKFRYVEFFPLDIGNQEDIGSIQLDKHIFKGIKVPKNIRTRNKVSRFPINDLKNFAQFGSRGREKESEFYAIMNYRKELGSNNVMPHLETAFKERMDAGYKPAPMFVPPENTLIKTPATLSLGRYLRKEGQDVFSKNVPGSRSILSARMRATLSNIAEPQDYNKLLDVLVPGGIPTRVTDEEAFSKLVKSYRHQPEQLSIIEKAYHASGKQNIRPMNESYEPFEEEEE